MRSISDCNSETEHASILLQGLPLADVLSEAPILRSFFDRDGRYEDAQSCGQGRHLLMFLPDAESRRLSSL